MVLDAMQRDGAESLVEAVIAADSGKSLLRIITCGSVDDGKSTLIGRLLYDSQLLYEDQLAALRQESRNRPVGEGKLDFSLLVDGLQAEREQGITIDVAYRFFATAARKFIVADTPGHEQYTRNMATGASGADLAIILIDARKGILVQTRRHLHICDLMGIRHYCVVVNKMDAVGYAQERFEEIRSDIMTLLGKVAVDSSAVVPVSALNGDFVASRSQAMSWYDGPTLIEHLERVDVREKTSADKPFRMPVQWVNRPFDDFRGFAGTVAAGTIAPGQSVRIARSGIETRVTRIATFDGDLQSASAGQAVTLVLDREVDISRGDMLVAPASPPYFADQFRAKLVWMSEHELMPGRSYLIRIGTAVTPGIVTHIKHRIDVDTLAEAAARTLRLNDLGRVNIATDQPVAFDAFADNRQTGGLIVIDRHTAATVGAGVIEYPLSRATNIAWQGYDITPAARAEMKRQKPCIVWFTGLSGSGKSTIANLLEKKLYADGRHVYVLDGDNVRHGLNRDLGFTEADRVENIRRVAEVAHLMADAGLIVIVSFISPFRDDRELAREVAKGAPFIEVFIDTPLSVCEARDPKGLYRKARSGAIKNFTGIDSEYEAPLAPELRIDTTVTDAESAAVEVAELVYALQT
jgi:bifunctional enzyme CysN/CysC